MRSLGELGIGLSVVFCVFVLALVAELCYIFYWKKSISADCLKSATEIEVKEKQHSSAEFEFVREASWVGSFGGYPTCVAPKVGAANSFGDSFSDPPPHLLFSIKEETKEDMELAAAAGLQGGTTKAPNSRLRSRTPSDVLTIHFTSGSSSPAASASASASVDTPFTTPPSSPPPPTERMPKLSPFAACAVRPMSCGKSISPPIADQMHNLSGCRRPSSPVTNIGRGRMPLRLLFERSPLLAGARPQSPLRPSTSLNLAAGGGAAAESTDVPIPPFYHHLSLAALFRQSSTNSSSKY